MNKQIVTTLLLAGAMLALFSCSKSSSTTPSTSSGATFNGSFFQITYNGNSYDVKDSAVGGNHYSAISASNTSTGITVIFNATGGNYGLSTGNLTFLGTGTGSYTLGGISQEGLITQNTPSILPLVDTGGGSATITHNGTDYTAGTFTTTLYTSGYGLSYPATGSFKVVY